MDEKTLNLQEVKEIDKVLDGNVGDDLISKMLDLENKMERTNSPHMQLIFWQLYMRRAAQFVADITGMPELKTHLEQWADDFASGMIGYKDKRMEKVTEAVKKAPEMVSVTNTQGQQPQEKRGIFNRKPKEDFE